MYAHLAESEFGVSELASSVGVSRSNLHRKVKEITGKPVNSFISEIRLNKAFEILKQGELTVSEVAYNVGFNSVPYFVKCFHEHFGYTPGKITHCRAYGLNHYIHWLWKKLTGKDKIIDYQRTIVFSLLAFGFLIVISLMIFRKFRTDWAINEALPEIEMHLKD